MPKTVYVAGKVGDPEAIADVQLIYKLCKKFGIVPAYDWTRQENFIPRPFGADTLRASKLSFAMHTAAAEADVFVLLPHENGKGMWEELGAFQENVRLTSRRALGYVVRGMELSTYCFLPALTQVPTLSVLITSQLPCDLEKFVRLGQ